jgi:putative endonuclease
MPSKTQDTGTDGEDYALAHLRSRGYLILTTNFKAPPYELDIVAKQDNILVFVEVRLKFNADYGYPEDTFGKAKKTAVLKGAEAYLIQHPWDGDVRFDFISIVLKPDFQLMHFEDAFR